MLVTAIFELVNLTFRVKTNVTRLAIGNRQRANNHSIVHYKMPPNLTVFVIFAI